MDEIKRLLLGETTINFTNVSNSIKVVTLLDISNCSDCEIVTVIFEFIDKLISIPLYRNHGIKLLDSLILKIPVQLLYLKAFKWANVCIMMKQTTFSQLCVLEKIIRVCNTNTAFDIYITQIISKILDICLSGNYNDDVTEQQLKCIKTCMDYYPALCQLVANTIEEHLSFFISSTRSVQVITCAAYTFTRLIEIPTSATNFNIEANWSKQFQKMCSTVHKIYHDFLNTDDSDMYTLVNEIPPFNNLYILNHGIDNQSKQYQRYIQLRNLLIFAYSMLKQNFSAKREIDVRILMNILDRGLSPNVYDAKSLGNCQILDLLQLHQIELLKLFELIVTHFNIQLIPLNVNVTNLLLACQELSQKEFLTKRSEYKKALYKLVLQWVLARTSDGHERPYNRIISVMIKELDLKKQNNVLHLEKNLCTSSTVEASQTSKIKTEHDVPYTQAQEDVCLNILNTLRIILTGANLRLEQTNYDELFNVLMENIEAYQSGNPNPPFMSEACATALYKTFISLFVQEYYRILPVFQLALNVLIRGHRVVQGSNPNMAAVLYQSLYILSNFCVHAGVLQIDN